MQNIFTNISQLFAHMGANTTAPAISKCGALKYAWRLVYTRVTVPVKFTQTAARWLWLNKNRKAMVEHWVVCNTATHLAVWLQMFMFPPLLTLLSVPFLSNISFCDNRTI